MSNQQTINTVLAALEREPSVNLHTYPLRLDFSEGVLTLEGEVEDIAAKKRTLLAGAGVAGVDRIVDRIRLTPAERMQDGEIRDHVCNTLQAESLLSSCALSSIAKGKPETVRAGGPEPDGSIEVEVRDGVVILNGTVTSHSHKRLAGVLAWWVPGSTDVVNGIEIDPPEDDSADELVDAVRLVLEKDPFVNASQIRVTCDNYIVVLEGLVKNDVQRKMAEADAWYVFQVDGVVNLLEVEE
ncbi:BON domain-containing protein [Geobacter sp. SVR]|uniref:BON domain-containing protein n=1 Tax=Geobacter sp. SVR TaxID=2495594 RepID=UPI00143EF58D|nr:BON domain-containing protein [Geobacter sp. SVR]BCS53355.1 hypothetical protein GSVR_16630 [Geobacter sp. SVR]GCF85519.1 hypothetical protein GSbR_21190 [Geobacter sp. SVR]